MGKGASNEVKGPHDRFDKSADYQNLFYLTDESKTKVANGIQTDFLSANFESCLFDCTGVPSKCMDRDNEG